MGHQDSHYFPSVKHRKFSYDKNLHSESYVCVFNSLHVKRGWFSQHFGDLDIYQRTEKIKSSFIFQISREERQRSSQFCISKSAPFRILSPNSR